MSKKADLTKEILTHFWFASWYLFVLKKKKKKEFNQHNKCGKKRSSRGGNGNPLQYSCLGNPMDRGAWRATVHGGRKESDTAEHTHVPAFGAGVATP